MRIVINTFDLCGHKTGVGHYAAELFRHLRHEGDDQVDRFPGGLVRGLHGTWRWLSRGRARVPGGAAQSPAPGSRSLLRRVVGRLHPGPAFRRRYFHTFCRLGRYDIYHEPNFIPLPSDLPTVLTVHDLSVLLHPEWHPSDRVAYYEQHFHEGLARCAHVITDSEFTRREVIRHLGVPPERVTRIYVGVRAGLEPLPEGSVRMELRRLGLPQQYLLCLGTIEPRKNVLTLLKAYVSLPASVRNRYPLLLVGGWGWGVGPVAEYLQRVGRPKGVQHLGYVPEGCLAALYNGARALAYPSLYEGFGLPPVEMLACGGAVLASTAGAVAETAGSAAHLIEPLDVAGWREALLRVCTEDEWWRWLRVGAVQEASPYTWERCATETLAVYRAVAGGFADDAGAEARPLPALQTSDTETGAEFARIQSHQS